MPDSVDEWRKFIRTGKLTNENILDYLELWSSSLAVGVSNNNRSINLRVWYSAVSEVRHAATHSGFVIKRDKIRSLKSTVEETLRERFDGTDEKGAYVLTPTREQAHAAIVCFAEYGYLIFKSTGQNVGFNWKILN
jgi:hypothetical protein